MTLRIIPATLRDLSYIAANLRAEDRAEIDCQIDQCCGSPGAGARAA